MSILDSNNSEQTFSIKCPRCGKIESVTIALNEIQEAQVECDCGHCFSLSYGRQIYDSYAHKKAQAYTKVLKVQNQQRLKTSLQNATMRMKASLKARQAAKVKALLEWLQTTPGLTQMIEQVKSELPYLQMKLQSTLTLLTALKVDSSSHRQNVWQNNVGGLVGDLATVASMGQLYGSVKNERAVESEIQLLSEKIAKHERLLEKYHAAIQLQARVNA